MASQNSIQRYLIIISKIRSSGGISLKELHQEVSRELTAHGALHIASSPKTLSRDLAALRGDFGIAISYDPRRNCYHFPDDEESSPENIETVLEAFNILNSLNADTGMRDFVFPDHRTYRGIEHLYPLLKAVQRKRAVFFHYQKYGEDTYTERKIRPYALKEVRDRWYLLGIQYGEDKVKSFGLDRMSEVKTLSETFTRRSIDINAAYRECYGIVNREDIPPEEVILSFNKDDGRYVDSEFIHHSQRRINDPTRPDRFVFRLFLRVTDDFILGILARGHSLEVISPLSLREEIHRIHLESAAINYVPEVP